jgi:hypothetical protein
MNLRRLNDEGIVQFSEFLDSLNGDYPRPYPSLLLTDPLVVEEVFPIIEIQKQHFLNRFAAAEYLFKLFKGSDMKSLDSDKGLWAWLALYFFNDICPPDTKGGHKPGERARWILEPSAWRHYYRHLLAGPFHVYSAYSDHPGRVMIVLCGTLDKPGDMYEQLASRQEIITNGEMMEVATSLYFDSTQQRPKRGATNRKRRGNVRRFVDILNQYDVTYDLYSLRAKDIIQLLPDEFSSFLNASP